MPTRRGVWCGFTLRDKRSQMLVRCREPKLEGYRQSFKSASSMLLPAVHQIQADSLLGFGLDRLDSGKGFEGDFAGDGVADDGLRVGAA